MKIIYRYLFKELLVTSLATVSVLTFLMLAINIFRDIFDLLLSSEVSFWLIAKMVLLLIPFLLTYTLPWGLLLATLLVYGRMSQDSELLALKASGIGIALVAAPAVWLALGFSLFSFYVNAYVGPRCRLEFRDITFDIASNNPLAFFKSDKVVNQLDGYMIYVGQAHGRHLEDIHIWQIDPNTKMPLQSMRADRAEIQPDLANQRLVLVLYNARQEMRSSQNPGDLTKIQSGGRAGEMPVEISLAALLEKKAQSHKSLGSTTLDEIRQEVLNPTELPQGGNYTPMLTEIQKRIAFSLSCFTFVLVGIPLAIQAQRRETSVGIVLSVAIAIGYYLVAFVAESLKKNANVYPEAIIWAPNFIFQAIGIYLLVRVNRK